MVGTSAQSEAETGLASMVDDLDVLIVQEDGELDEAEHKLCNPSAQLETVNNTENDSLLKKIEYEYEEEDSGGGRGGPRWPSKNSKRAFQG